MKLRRLCSAALAGMLVVSACSSDGEPVALAVPAGDASAFCLGWPEARAALAAELGDTTREWEVRGNVEVARLALDEADARVPAVLRPDWTSATKYQDTVITLLEIADFNPETIPVQLIDAAFGVGGGEAAAAASEASIERIDAWALDQCGDFCELWPRLNRALGWVGEGGGDTHQDFQQQGPRDVAMILSAGPLVPVAVRDAWDGASASKLRLFEFFTSDLEDLDGQEWNQRMGEALGYPIDPNQLEGGFDALIQEFGQPPPDVDWRWWFASLAHDENLGTIDAWVADNCESAGVLGLPGVVRVEDPGRSPDPLLIAAVPVGTDIGGIEDASDFLAVACSHQAPGEIWSSSLLERNSGFDRPCINLDQQDLGARPAILAAGEYDLFIGSFSRGIGDFNTYVPAPDLCAVVPITVAGDIDVTVPDLEPCDLGPLAGTAEEVARRQPPDTGGPTGTLRVTLTEHLSDEGVYVDHFLAVLSAGTTLNQIALGDAWPVGRACMSGNQPLDRFLDDMLPPEFFEDRSAEFEEADRQAEQEAEQRQAQREEVERQLAALQAERQEVERQQAELGNLSKAEREERERQLADWQMQLDEQERWISDELIQLEEGDRQAQQHRQEEQRQTEETQEEILRQVTPLLEAIDGGGIPVPILPFPAAPTGDEGCSGVQEFLGMHDSSWREPPLAVLPAGDYDVYVLVSMWNEEMGDEDQKQCATLTVSVAGETQVKAPPLGDCP